MAIPESVIIKVPSRIYSDAVAAFPNNEVIAIVEIYTITATSEDETMGTITGAGEYEDGTEVTLTAVPSEGYEFVQWSDGTTENPYTFTATENKTLTATFKAVEAEEPSNDVLPSTDINTFDYALYFNNIEHRAGDFPLELNMKCAKEDITGFQCNVYLPEGVTWKTTVDKRGNVNYVQPIFNEDRTDTSYHTLDAGISADGSMNIIVYSMNKDNILETDGALMTLPLEISEEMAEGDYNIILRNIVMYTTENEETKIPEVVSRLTIPSYILGDVNDDDEVNVGDIITIIDVIRTGAAENYIEAAADVNEDGEINVGDIIGIIDIIRSGVPAASNARMSAQAPRKAPTSDSNMEVIPFTISSGTESQSVELEMNNPDEEFTGFQCDIYLPTGINWASTVDKRGNVKYTQPTFNATAERTDANYHTVNAGLNSDGSMNIVVYSMEKERFLDEEGAILDMPFMFDENLDPGVYDVTVKRIIMSHTDGTTVKAPDYIFSIMVGQPIDKTLALMGHYTEKALEDYNSSLSNNNEVCAIDFNRATALADGATIATANKNALIYLAEGMEIANTENVVVGDECESLVLTDGYPFFAPKNFSAQSASYRREGINANGWYSCVVPFEAEIPEEANVEEFGAFNGSTIRLQSLQSITANAPFFFKPGSDAFEVTAENVEVAATTSATFEIGNYTASYEQTAEGSITRKYALKADGTGFGICGDDAYLVPFRAVLTIDNASNARVINVDRSTPTGIETIAAPMRNEEIFDIQGRRVSNATKAGIYVANGQKYIVK